jgi:hypothetical protein
MGRVEKSTIFYLRRVSVETALSVLVRSRKKWELGASSVESRVRRRHWTGHFQH